MGNDTVYHMVTREMEKNTARRARTRGEGWGCGNLKCGSRDSLTFEAGV